MGVPGINWEANDKLSLSYVMGEGQLKIAVPTPSHVRVSQVTSPAPEEFAYCDS